MNTSSWKKAVDLVAKVTPANPQVQAAAMAEWQHLQSLPLSALSVDDSGPPQVTYDCQQPMAATTPKATSTETPEIPTEAYCQILQGMSNRLYPTLVVDGSLATHAPDNHSMLHTQLTSEVDKYLQEAAERRERVINYFDGQHMSTNTTTQQQEVESVEHKEEKIPELIDHDTSMNGEINTEHYIRYHDELETIPEENEEEPPMTAQDDNISFNQLYYIAENCVDRYYSKVIETFVALLKCQFVDRQLLLVNTARSLNFLEEYVHRQALIWKIFQKHENIPDDIQDFHFHIDDFKTNIEKEFSLLKEATSKNVENFQSSLNLQQTYSTALCSHVNNIYNNLAEIQQQLPHSGQHMNTGDVTQIEVPDFDPNIDEALPIPADQNTDHEVTQGSANSIQQFSRRTATTRTPASSQQDAQDVD